MKKKRIGLSLIILCSIVIILVIYLGGPGDIEKQPATSRVVSSEGVSIQSKENAKEERIRNAAKIRYYKR